MASGENPSLHRAAAPLTSATAATMRAPSLPTSSTLPPLLAHDHAAIGERRGLSCRALPRPWSRAGWRATPPASSRPSNPSNRKWPCGAPPAPRARRRRLTATTPAPVLESTPQRPREQLPDHGSSSARSPAAGLPRRRRQLGLIRSSTRAIHNPDAATRQPNGRSEDGHVGKVVFFLRVSRADPVREAGQGGADHHAEDHYAGGPEHRPQPCRLDRVERVGEGIPVRT